MTREVEQAVRLLVHRHGMLVQRSLVEHLKRVIPIPALHKALKSWGRKEEWDSLESTVTKVVEVLIEPVTVTRAATYGGEELDLTTLYDAAPRLGVAGRTLYDLSTEHPQFPDPFIVTSVGKLWVFDDVASFYKAYRPYGSRRGRRSAREVEKGAL